MTDDERIPPSNLEAEAAVIGAVLVDGAVMDGVREIVEPKHFWAPIHEMLFASLCALHDRGIAIDKISVAEDLRARGVLHRIGGDDDDRSGLAYLSGLMDAVPSVASVTYYATIVREKATLRELIAAGAEIRAIGFAGEADPATAVARANERIGAIVDAAAPPDRRPVDMTDAFAEIDDLVASDDVLLIPTPYATHNAVLKGWARGGIVIIAGAPKHGKTWYAQGVVAHAAATIGRVAIFPLEIDRKLQTLRLVQNFSSVSADDILARKPLTEQERDAVAAARARLASMPISTFRNPDRGSWSTDEIVSACRRLADREPLAAVLIDHIGFLRDVLDHGRDTKADRQERALAKLLAMSRALNVPVFIVWHFNRDGSGKTEPSIFDLRDGGNPEGYAHHILFVTRPAFDANDGSQRDGHVTIAANRSGKHGKIRMKFDDVRGVWMEQGGVAWFDPPDPEQLALAEYARATFAEQLPDPAEIFGGN